MRQHAAVFALLALILISSVHAVPMPIPSASKPLVPKRAAPTPAPVVHEYLDFYQPKQKITSHDTAPSLADGDNSEAKSPIQWEASRVQKRQDYPSFPAQYPSCYNCQQKYSSLSSCMEASSVFENATDIFNSPWSYLSVLKCSCTDTFQAVYPQCVECFQLTDQCRFLGTDAAGTGASQMVSNVRSICSFASSILGKAQSANYPDYNFTYTPSIVPSYTDVTTTGPGYLDQATGAIFSSGSIHSTITVWPLFLVCSVLLISLFVML